MAEPLDKRTLQLAKNVRTRTFIHKLPKTLTNIEDRKQLTRSSGSIGANYIEAIVLSVFVLQRKKPKKRFIG